MPGVLLRRPKQFQQRLDLIQSVEQQRHVGTVKRRQQRESRLQYLPDLHKMHNSICRDFPAWIPSRDAGPMSSNAANREMPRTGTPSRTNARRTRSAWDLSFTSESGPPRTINVTFGGTISARTKSLRSGSFDAQAPYRQPIALRGSTADLDRMALGFVPPLATDATFCSRVSNRPISRNSAMRELSDQPPAKTNVPPPPARSSHQRPPAWPRMSACMSPGAGPVEWSGMLSKPFADLFRRVLRQGLTME